MEYVFKQGKNENIFLLLHGTGGNEHDLIPFAEMLDDEAGILSVRGEVQENGMNRFFKRHGEGQYDVADLEKRGEDLLQFIKEKSVEYQFNMENIIILGFSNGSNIGINILLREGVRFKKAILCAPLYPLDLTNHQKDLSELNVFLSLGHEDPIVPEAESKRVIQIFEERNAAVATTWVQGHRLTRETLIEARQWLQQNN
jgi:phospholipase/carboxylesterase